MKVHRITDSILRYAALNTSYRKNFLPRLLGENTSHITGLSVNLNS